jgi:hypothetical protein
MNVYQTGPYAVCLSDACVALFVESCGGLHLSD